jgi:hypothetical protein
MRPLNGRNVVFVTIENTPEVSWKIFLKYYG